MQAVCRLESKFFDSKFDVAKFYGEKMADKETNAVLTQFNKQIRMRLGNNLKALILFGSKARGDDEPDSDYDCLAVVDEVTHDIKNHIDELAGELLFEHSAVFSIFPISEKAYQQRPFDPFLNNIRREGVVL